MGVYLTWCVRGTAWRPCRAQWGPRCISPDVWGVLLGGHVEHSEGLAVSHLMCEGYCLAAMSSTVRASLYLTWCVRGTAWRPCRAQWGPRCISPDVWGVLLGGHVEHSEGLAVSLLRRQQQHKQVERRPVVGTQLQRSPHKLLCLLQLRQQVTALW